MNQKWIEQRRQVVLDEIKRQGLTCIRTGKEAWRITGRNVDVLATDLAHIEPADLRPSINRRGIQAWG